MTARTKGMRCPLTLVVLAGTILSSAVMLCVSLGAHAEDDAPKPAVQTADPKPAAPAGNAGAAEANWSRFRGPDGLGVSDAKGLPQEWGADKNIVWKTALPGAGASSPVTYGDRIFLTCYTGYGVPGQPGGKLEQLKRHLLALRRDTGEILWNQAVDAKLPEEGIFGCKNRGYGQHDITAEPQFVDPEKGDFRLKPGSPGIDMGVDVGLKTDLEGTPRPQGRAPDIGAFELKAADPKPAPADGERK